MTPFARRPSRIAVLGGGAWGTALAQAALAAGNDVTLWARAPETVEAIVKHQENPRYLPGIALGPALKATTRPAEALAGADAALVVVPTQRMRAALESLRPDFPPDLVGILCAKGIERSTGLLPSQIAEQTIPGIRTAVLSGPSFAVDVARGLPTAVTVAASEEADAHALASMLSSRQFRCYSSTDRIGVEIGGALKNVLAIAAGIVIGRGLGSSAQAALITRGFVELRRIGAAFGAIPETLMGLSGLGDLILTCGSEKSRNFAYGLALGRGDDAAGGALAEGVATAGIAARFAREHQIEAPIVDAVARVLDGSWSVSDAIGDLLNRPIRPETA